MTDRKIWLVFNPDGRSPTFVHQSYESARDEAKRLARNVPDQTFYVMESVGKARRQDVSWYAYGRSENQDDIPF